MKNLPWVLTVQSVLDEPGTQVKYQLRLASIDEPGEDSQEQGYPLLFTTVDELFRAILARLDAAADYGQPDNTYQGDKNESA